MKELIWICGILLWTLTMVLLLRQQSPAFAYLLTAAVAILIAVRLLGTLQTVLGAFREIAQQAQLEDELAFPVLRVLLTAVLARVVSALCRDAGQSALSAQVEMAGVLLSLLFCLPLLQQVFALLEKWVV